MKELRLGRGMASMALAVLAFATVDCLAKLVSHDYPVVLTVWARYLVHFLAMVLLLGPRMRLALVRTKRPGIHLLRGVVLLVSTGCFYFALQLMSLGEAAAITFVAPLLVVAFSGPLLRERATRSQWMAVLAGFVGVLIVIRPRPGHIGLAVLLPLGAATCYSLYQVITRRLSGEESPLTMLFYTAMVGVGVSSLMLPFLWRAPTPGQALILCCMGLLGGTGHFLLIKAVEFAPPSKLAPIIYTQLVWATAYGIVVFHERLSSASLLGIAIIVGAGLYAGTQKPLPVPAAASHPTTTQG